MKPALTLLILIIGLTACSPVVPSPTLAPPTATVIVPTPTSVFANTGFACCVTPAVFTHPDLDQSEVREGSRGSGRDALIEAGIAEEVLQVYEEQATLWLEQNNFSRFMVDAFYVQNGLRGDEFRWQMVFTLKKSGDLIWSGAGGGTYPTGVVLDPATELVSFDPHMVAERLRDTSDAVVRFNPDGIPVVLSGSPVRIGDKLYYPQLRNPLTRELEENLTVKASYETKYAEWLPYLNGIAKTPEEYLVMDRSRVSDFVAFIKSRPYQWKGALPDQSLYWELFQETDCMGIRLHLNDPDVYEIVSSLKIMDDDMKYYSFYSLVWRIRNRDGSDSVIVTIIGKWAKSEIWYEDNVDIVTELLQTDKVNIDRINLGIIAEGWRPYTEFIYQNSLYEGLNMWELANQWVTSGICPPELEGRLLAGSIGKNRIVLRP